MPTKNPRINITFEQDIADLIAAIAEKESKSVSGLAKQLVLEALELREDIVLSAIAKARDSDDKPSSKYVKHDDFWK